MTLAEGSLIEEEIGKIFIINDRLEETGDPFRVPKVSDSIRHSFCKNLSNADASDKADFMWSVVRHIGFDGGEMRIINLLIAIEIKDEITKRMDNFIASNEKTPGYENRILFYKKIKSEIEGIVLETKKRKLNEINPCIF